MKQLLLSFDTSTPCGSVAIVSDNIILAEARLNVKQRPHSDYILRFAQMLLKECGCVPSDLTGLCVINGPGSFTGLRVGLATVQGLAKSLQVPVYQVSSLLVMGFMYGPSPGTQYCLLDARKHELYGTLLKWDSFGPTAQHVFVLSPAEICTLINTHSEIDPVVLIGHGGELYRDIFMQECRADLYFSGSAVQYPCAADAALMCIYNWPNIVPTTDVNNIQALYVRSSDAELQRRR